MAVERKRGNVVKNDVVVDQPAKAQYDAAHGPGKHALPTKSGMLHLVECTCILPQYLKRTPPLFHKFVVFSVIDENDTVVEKIVQCNNCGLIHRVTDICKSEVVYGREESRSMLTKADIAACLNSRLVDVLKANDCELPVWEYARFVVDEGLWGTAIVVSSDVVDGRRTGKFIMIAGPDKFGVSQYSEQFVVDTTA